MSRFGIWQGGGGGEVSIGYTLNWQVYESKVCISKTDSTTWLFPSLTMITTCNNFTFVHPQQNPHPISLFIFTLLNIQSHSWAFLILSTQLLIILGMIQNLNTVNLRDRDNLRRKDKRPVPKVSFVRRFDCIFSLSMPHIYVSSYIHSTLPINSSACMSTCLHTFLLLYSSVLCLHYQ